MSDMDTIEWGMFVGVWTYNKTDIPVNVTYVSYITLKYSVLNSLRSSYAFMLQ